MISKTQFLVVIAAVLTWAGKAYPYSHDGHYLVGAIADSMLDGTPTQQKIQALIGSVSLAEAANLADDLKGWDPLGAKHNRPFRVTSNKRLNSALQAFLLANETIPSCFEPLDRQYHYCDVQVARDPSVYEDGQVGVSNHDIVHMIAFCIDVLSGKVREDNPQKITRPVALVLLAHYVGDIHQPLHVGAQYFDLQNRPVDPNQTTRFATDSGGNTFAFQLGSAPVPNISNSPNLHIYWDDNAVRTATNHWASQVDPANSSAVELQEIAGFLANRLPQGWNEEPAIDPAAFAVACANEILPLARQAYNRVSLQDPKQQPKSGCVPLLHGTALADNSYEEFAGQTVADEIHKAGHRLADLLKAVLP